VPNLIKIYSAVAALSMREKRVFAWVFFVYIVVAGFPYPRPDTPRLSFSWFVCVCLHGRLRVCLHGCLCVCVPVSLLVAVAPRLSSRYPPS